MMVTPLEWEEAKQVRSTAESVDAMVSPTPEAAADIASLKGNTVICSNGFNT